MTGLKKGDKLIYNGFEKEYITVETIDIMEFHDTENPDNVCHHEMINKKYLNGDLITRDLG